MGNEPSELTVELESGDSIEDGPEVKANKNNTNKEETLGKDTE